MIRYEEALAIISALRLPTRTVRLPLEQANGAVLADALTALVPSPPYTNSAMDGYAVRRAEALAGPLAVAGSVFARISQTAGQESDSTPGAPDPVAAGACVKIMTGGRLPAWADTVIPVEAALTDADGSVRFLNVPEAGANIRRRGSDLETGSPLLAAGTTLDPERLMVAAAFGHRTVPVRAQPKLCLVATGDELVEPGEPLPEGAVYNSSKYFLLAAAQSAGLTNVTHVTISDDADAAARILETLLAGPDAKVLITTGAVSAGERDFIPELAERLGFEARFHRVAIRPGKPVYLAVRGDAVWLGLPGNPVSTAVGWHAFARPLLAAACGVPVPARRTLVLKNEVRKPEHLRCFFRAEVNGDKAWVGSRQGSAQLAASLHHEAYVELPEGFARIPADTRVAAIIV